MIDYLLAERPKWAVDQIVSHIDVELSLKDRLRVLLKGKFSIRHDCFTERVVGRTEGRSIVSVPALWDRRRGKVFYDVEHEGVEVGTKEGGE